VRLGIFGGTFDPPHVGHLLAAGDAADALSLDLLVFVPNAVQPLKGAPATSGQHRLAMVRLLIDDDPGMAVDPLEIDREGLSYSVDTLGHFAERWPDAERFFLVGADVLESFDRWREPGRVLELAQLVILRRNDGPPAADGGEIAGQPAPPAGAIELPTRRIDISSTEIRARVREKRSIRGFVPDAVAEYIAATGLYR
jgi:nicotinate-nucleotide adenylyltransferase